MSIYAIQPLGLAGVRTYPLAARKSKVTVREFAKPFPDRAGAIANFFGALPDVLAARDLRQLLAAIHRAKKSRRAILWGIGGHVVKAGLGPLLIDLMRRGARA